MSVAAKVMLITLAMVVALAALMGATALIVGFEWSVLGWMAALAVLALLTAVLPVSTRNLGSRPDPAKSYAEAVSRFNAARAHPEGAILSLCEARLLLHGHPTDRVYVLIHGLSNCPHSFAEWAPQLKAAGHTVMLPRMPWNGFADNTTDALRHCSAHELANFGDWCIDIASALGREVVVVGISGGGVVSAWIAQNRADVARAVLVAPAFGLAEFGGLPNAFLMRLVLLLPNFSVWRDPLRRAAAPQRANSYKRMSSHGTGEYLRLGLAVRRQAGKSRPAARSIVVVTNGNDSAVDSTLTAETATLWESKGADVTRYKFPKEAYLPHELFDPSEPGAVPSLVYPTITALAEPTGPVRLPFDLGVPATL